MAYTIEEIDFGLAGDDELVPILELFNETRREVVSRHVDLTLGDLRRLARSPGVIQKWFLARDGDGRLAGACETRYTDDDTNPDTLRCRILVWPEFRRRGAGTAMLERICQEADDLGRTKLLAMHYDTVPAGVAFARAAGGVDLQQFHENVLRVEDLDVGLLRDWVERGRARATGYKVEVHEGDWPEEVHEDVARLFYILERDSPMSEGQTPREWSTELIGKLLEHLRDGSDALFSMAFDPSGRAIGMSEMIRRHADPGTWMVTVTMVDPEHRGKSIGKWLKGAVNLAALETWEGGVYQETGNAIDNEAMLAINRTMGFEHELTMTEVEVAVADARACIASRVRAG